MLFVWTDLDSLLQVLESARRAESRKGESRGSRRIISASEGSKNIGDENNNSHILSNKCILYLMQVLALIFFTVINTKYFSKDKRVY